MTIPIPTANFDEAPTVCLRLNEQWIPVILGGLQTFLNPPQWGIGNSGVFMINPAPVWDGDEDAQFEAEQQVLNLMTAIEECGGDTMTLEELLPPGEDGSVIQADDGAWIVTLPDFRNLVAKTLEANKVPLTVKAAASQTADLQQWNNSDGSNKLKLQADGKFLWNNPDYLTGIFGEADGFVKMQGYYGTTLRVWYGSGLNVFEGGSTQTIIRAGATITLAADDVVVSGTFRTQFFGTPATSSAAGHVGQMYWDENYMYLCVAENTWKRCAFETW